MENNKVVVLIAILLTALPIVPALAAEKDPPPKYYDEPVFEGVVSTTVVPGTVIYSGSNLIFDSIDSAGRTYTAEYNASTSTLVAVSGAGMIQRSFSAPEMLALQARGQAAGGEIGVGVGSLALIPIVAGMMCYANDQIIKHRMISSCQDAGGTVVMENTGFCGFNASYRCENIPAPNVPAPVPTPVPGPSAGYSGIWKDSGSTYMPIGAADLWSVWTYDDDWF